MGAPASAERLRPRQMYKQLDTKDFSLSAWARCCVLLAILSFLSLAHGQQDEVERGLERRPGVEPERPELPEYAEEPGQTPLALPAIESLQLPRQSLAGMPSVFLQRVLLVDSSVLTSDEVRDISAPYINRNATAEDLQALRFALTQLYVERGYITSGVVLPDQQVEAGAVLFEAIEGRLDEVQVSTDGRLRESYIAARLVVADDLPLNVNEIQNALRNLHQDPLIHRLNGRLIPGEQRGSARLLVEVEEARAYLGELTVSNTRAPSVGAEWAELNIGHRNLLGFGDRVYLRYGLANGLEDWSATYAFPLGGSGLTLGLNYNKSDSQVVEEPFDRIDINSQSRGFALDLVYPWLKTGNHSLTFTASFENRSSDTRLLGVPFSFSPGVQNGNSEVTVLRLTADWIDRQLDRVIAVRARINQGISALGSTSNDGVLPDSKFTSFLLQAQWARRFGENRNQLILRADIQESLGGLLPTEKFSIGGMDSVRGYRQNLMVRDSGWLLSAEWRMPAFADERGLSHFQWAFFADAGHGVNKDFGESGPSSIASVGAGFLWAPMDAMQTEFYFAAPFEEVDFSDQDLQDQGVHFRLNYRFF